MVTMNLGLDQEALEKLKAMAEKSGKRVDELVTELVLGTLGDEYDLDEEEERAVAEGIADMNAGRFVSHGEMMRMLKEQRGR